MTPENEKTFRLFIRVMAAAVSLLVFGLIVALLDELGIATSAGPLLEWVIFFVAVYTGGSLARPAGDAIKKAIETFIDGLDHKEDE